MQMTFAISGVVSLFQRKQFFQIYSHSDDRIYVLSHTRKSVTA